MTRKATWIIVILANLVLLTEVLFIAQYPHMDNLGFKDSAAILTFVGGAAVSIERAIEVFWTFIGGVAGTYWPLNLINNQVKTMVGELSQAVKPIYVAARAKVNQIAAAEKWTDDQRKKAEDEIANLESRFDELKNKLPPDNQRVQLLIAASAQHVKYLTTKYAGLDEELKNAKSIANSAIDGLQDFLASFKDNPGRRLISIYLGMVVGLVVAGYFGLDIFQAVLNPESRMGADPHHLHVIITGLVMGLGSAPTHEVIRVLQEYKKARKAENIATPDQP